MVNQVVLEYLKVNRGNYKIDDLKKKVLASGYSQKDIDDALLQLNKQTQGNVPSVPATIKEVNKTNINLAANKPAAQPQPAAQSQPAAAAKSKKKKSWLKWLMIIWAIILVLGGVGFGIWYFVFRDAAVV